MKLLTNTINKEPNQEDKTIKNILDAAKSRFFLKREHLTFTESFQAAQQVDYQYTLALDLDETLIHFVSNEKKFKLRPSCLLFLYEMANLFEVVIFTAAAKDYADYILNILERRLVARYGPLQDKPYISRRFYRQDCELQKEVYIKDLSVLKTELSRTIIVDNLKENFCL